MISIPFKARAICLAGSIIKDAEAPGGFGPCDNFPRRVDDESRGRGLYLLAQPEVPMPFSDRGMGMRLCLVNQSGLLLSFEASDSRLAIVQEALDEGGAWKAIEYIPSSGCGNSFHRVFLPSEQFWEFVTPRYKGSFETQLRFTLSLSDRSQIHSNTFEGSINPEQFTTKQGHRPESLMDPYVD
ncbi:MAG: hypothetical protein IT428_04620 [Planctomycetaceae bacterium]|nr:hypothetical protein [Planctomycetaceae bacterium]